MSGLFEGYQIASPPFGPEDGRRLAAELFGLHGEVSELGSHQDRNFLIEDPAGARAVVKIANPHFGRDSLEMQNAAMHHVAEAGLPFGTPVPLAAPDGREIIPVDHGEETFDVRATTWVDGDPLTAAAHLDGSVRSAVGLVAAEIALALRDFDHPAADRVLQWDLKHARAVVDGLIVHVDTDERREMVERAMAVHDSTIDRLAGELRMQVIHGDVTDYNVVGVRDADGRLLPSGLIDFGDMTRSYLAAEAAVAAGALTWHDPDDGLAVVVDVVAGFHARMPLTEAELAAVFPLVLGRCAANAVSTWQQASMDPGNRYANDAVDGDWGALAAVAAIPAELAEAAIRAACGLEPHPAVAVLRVHLRSLRPVPVVEPGGRTLKPVDLGVASAAYAYGEWERPGGVAAAAAVGAGELGIGRYGEARLHRSGRPAPAEPQSVHLGADVFAAEGEAVRCPIDARLHEASGGRIVLEADLPGGGAFRIALDGVTPGEIPAHVPAGHPIGTVAPAGDRPLPHVHVQLGLCAHDPLPEWATPSLRDAWQGLCPDPSALIGADAAAPPPARDKVLAERTSAVAGAQQLYFRHPPQIARGWRHRLYDADGRPYLDMVNNVAVLGHSHPGVAGAATRALRLLNTNSRFLYDGMSRFAARLVELLPEPLDQVFFVSTGSEANDLALRLARTYTGRRDVIAVAGAYHGWTTATYDVGTSLFDNPAAAAAPPPGLRVVPQANTYRGAYGPDDPDAGEKYAEHVGEVSPGAAAFICEPVLGNAGGVLAPQGYLEHAFRHVREQGGVCIADEVQVGYGRLGSWFWAFQQQGVVPDIVTIAKATGNGHPVGAVITTKPIADAFGRNASFFSSVGGSPLSCEIGIAVLDAIRDEGLQENAARVGAHLRGRLVELAERHPLVGAVHGTGLYLGAELVCDGDPSRPATAEGYALCERMRELGVIIQPTGDHENVLKIKPPLCIEMDDADLFADTLDRVLTDGW